MRRKQVEWDIRRNGRAWRKEALERFNLVPEKTEMVDGKLFCSEGDRLIMLGLLLENVGIDAAIQLGRPEVWKQAVKNLD